MEVSDEFIGAKIVDGHVIIRWPVSAKPKKSDSGKSTIIASSRGFAPVIGTEYSFSFNVTEPAD
jgi:hypothetical protein